MAVILAATLLATLAGQSAPAWLKPVSRVSAIATLEAAPKTSKTAVVAVDVAPAEGIHVYAPGNKNYIAVDVSAVARRGVIPGKPEYPPAQRYVFGELREVVQVYSKPFRVRLPVTFDGGRPASLDLTVRYQACTDKVCYPPATLALEVAIPPAR